MGKLRRSKCESFVAGRMVLSDAVREALEKSGCRYTKQRATVYEYLLQVDTHPTAEQVYRAVRRRLPKISLATVYKALEALVAARLANRLTYGDAAARYDGRRDEHYHLRDLESGEVRDLPTTYDPDLLDKIDSRLVERLQQNGFQVTGYRMEVLGHFR
jgi:Fe2+ or Zn2+ uptake regulation protein